MTEGQVADDGAVIGVSGTASGESEVHVMSGPTLSSGTETATRVARLLERANEAIEDFRLTRPEGNNALDYYNEVLALDPGNLDAVEGYRRVANRYGVLARSEIAKGNLAKAGDFVSRGLSLDPDNAQLLAIESDVNTAIAEGRTGSEVEGESPKELYERIKGWFK